MDTAIILKEALNYFAKKDKFELSVVLFEISVERLMKQQLCEINDVLVLDKNNRIEHLVKFKKLSAKLSNESSKQSLEKLKETKDSFKTIAFGELIARYDFFFDISEERKSALQKLANLRNNVVHYFQYFMDEVVEGLFILTEIIPFIREMIQDIQDSEKYVDIFNDKIIKKLKIQEDYWTKLQTDQLNRKLAEKKEEYNEMGKEDIEIKKIEDIRERYNEREILKEGLQCPACKNYNFHFLKLFIEKEDNESPEFIIKGLCLICGLELSEEELKSLKLLEPE